MINAIMLIVVMLIVVENKRGQPSESLTETKSLTWKRSVLVKNVEWAKSCLQTGWPDWLIFRQLGYF